MVRALVRLGVLQAGILLASPVLAIPYWFAWEGNDFPENQGWTRSYNNAGDVRTLNGGMMTLDGMSVPPGYDSHRIDYPGSIDPDPNEMFVMQWRMRVQEVVPNRWDVSIGVFSDESWAAGFHYSETQTRSAFEPAVLDISPNLFRDYEFRSDDMRTYELFVDGVLVHSGAFVHVVTASRMAWGDGFAFTQSTSVWDYVRVGVVPESAPLWILLVLAMIATSVRRA
jgi:hypothetical protein